MLNSIFEKSFPRLDIFEVARPLHFQANSWWPDIMHDRQCKIVLPRRLPTTLTVNDTENCKFCQHENKF